MKYLRAYCENCLMQTRGKFHHNKYVLLLQIQYAAVQTRHMHSIVCRVSDQQLTLAIADHDHNLSTALTECFCRLILNLHQFICGHAGVSKHDLNSATV